MGRLFIILLVPLTSILLVCAQAFWGSAAKSSRLFSGSLSHILTNFITNPKIWAGAGLYLLATICYFGLLSRYRFFSVQVGMTGLAIIASTLLSIALFHEKVSLLNIVGLVLLVGGAGLVFSK